MKITKQQLKKLIKEELALEGFARDVDVEPEDPQQEMMRQYYAPGGEGHAGSAEEGGDPAMSTGPKLDRIIAILEKAFPGL